MLCAEKKKRKESQNEWYFPSIYLQGEEVELTQVISTVKARGQVEKWLLELERIMKETVLSQICDSIESYSDEEFNDWIFRWPGQCVNINNNSFISAMSGVCSSFYVMASLSKGSHNFSDQFYKRH